MQARIIDVAATVLQDADGRILLAERTARQISPGYWELPGGKVDPGETPDQAARRELHEEIGVQVDALQPWLTYEHRFPLRRIRLHLFRARSWSGTPKGCEGQRLAWVDPARPAVAPLLPSCERALTALGLPPLYAVLEADDEPAVAGLQRALAGGARLVQLHAHALSPDQRCTLARRLGTIAAAHGARVLLHGTAQDAHRAGIAGLHTEPGELRRLTARPDVRLWIPACRDATDIARAIAIGADAVIISPVLGTDPVTGAAPLGWDGLARAVAATPVAVYAAGGMTPALLPQARRAGAIGIATSRWGDATAAGAAP
jgi:8-oxo-dGTP diphosphatase